MLLLQQLDLQTKTTPMQTVCIGVVFCRYTFNVQAIIGWGYLSWIFISLST